MPQVSIIICVYNVEKYLRQCLDSVINQTLKNIQIICINDGSTDGSLAILQEYADRDRRIEVYSKPNEGLGIARNFAYPFIKGKYTTFLDPDDWLELDGLEHLFSLAEKHGADVVCTNYYFNEKAQTLKIPNQTCWISPGIKKRTWMLRYAPVFSWAKLYNSEFFLRNEIYFSKALRSQDIIVHWKTCLLGNVFCFCTVPTHHYRIVNIPSENAFRFGKRCLTVIQAMKEIDDFLQEYPIKEYRAWFSVFKFSNIWYYYCKADKETRKEFKKCSGIFTENDWEELLKMPHPISTKCFIFFTSRKYKFPFILWVKAFIKRKYERIAGMYPPDSSAPREDET